MVQKSLRGIGLALLLLLAPATAFAQCELRSPAPFSDQGFYDFNREYVQTLARWGIFKDDLNPVARTNVCPAFEPPTVPSLYAFSYTVTIVNSGDVPAQLIGRQWLLTNQDSAPPPSAAAARRDMVAGRHCHGRRWPLH